MRRTGLNHLTAIILSVLLLAACAPARAQTAAKAPSVPDTPAGRRLSEWLRLYNAGDFDAMRAFITASYARPLLEQAPAELRANYNIIASHASGGLKIVAVEKSSDDEIVALAETELTELRSRVTVRVAPEEPHVITTVTNIPVSESGARKMSRAEFTGWLDAHMKRLAAADVFSGSVLIAKDGKPIFQNAYGLASKAYNVPNRIDTKLNLGSMN